MTSEVKSLGGGSGKALQGLDMMAAPHVRAALPLHPDRNTKRSCSGEIGEVLAGPSSFLGWHRSLAPPDGKSRPPVSGGNRAATPADQAPILKRLHGTGESWLRPAHEFSRLFRQSAGTLTSLRSDADK
jgi:hypothetical protein